MDEMNPAYENFLNNMSRLGGTPRETTRRVSPAKFLGRDDIQIRVRNNSRKINVITRILRARRISTGEKISSLSGGSIKGVEQSIMDIKETMSSILETLQAQEKFEYERFLDMQRRQENEKRRKRETTLETDKKGMNLIRGGVEKAMKPVKNLFFRIIGFFVGLGVGRLLIKLLNFFKDPRNIGIVNAISGLVRVFFPFIVAGITAAAIGLGGLAIKFTKIASIITLLRNAFLFAAGARTVVTGAGVKTGFGKTLFKFLDPVKKFTGVGVPKMTKSGGRIIQGGSITDRASNIFKKIFQSGQKFNEGGVVLGSGNSDSVPAMLTPGEFVIRKEVVQKFGANNFKILNSGFKDLKNIYNTGRNVRFPNENSARMIDLIKDDFSQVTRSNKAFKEGSKSIRSLRPLKAFTPNMMKTGPTPLFRQSVERPFRALFGGGVKGIAKKIPILDLLLDLAFPKPLADGTLTGNQNAVPNLLPNNNQSTTTSMPDFSQMIDKIQNPNVPMQERNDLLNINFNEIDHEKLSTLGFEL